MTDFDHYRKFHHYLRRLIHLSIAIVPILYYWYAKPIADYLQLSINTLIAIVLIIIIILEIIRLAFGILVPGQRHYEKNQLSGFTWGSIGIAVVCLLAPKFGYQNAAFGLPLIWSWVFGDPVLGEARRFGLTRILVLCAGAIVISVVWLISALWLGTPYWVIPIIVPITLLAEWIKIPYVDDNFTMLIWPLVLVMVIT